jgi:hypothetical protein
VRDTVLPAAGLELRDGKDGEAVVVPRGRSSSGSGSGGGDLKA